jgi:hypothetical protein
MLSAVFPWYTWEYSTSSFTPVLSSTSYATGSRLIYLDALLNARHTASQLQVVSLHFKYIQLTMPPSSTNKDLLGIQPPNSCKRNKTSRFIENADTPLSKKKKANPPISSKPAQQKG